jgi:DNA-binding phage protein
MQDSIHRSGHQCCCPDCTLDPQSAIAAEHRLINQLVATFDEKSRRLYVAFLARQHGRGGIAKLAHITGLSRNTIRRGRQELLHPVADLAGRIRRTGGGRQRLEKKRH